MSFEERAGYGEVVPECVASCADADRLRFKDILSNSLLSHFIGGIRDKSKLQSQDKRIQGDDFQDDLVEVTG